MEQQEITVYAAITISGPLVYHLIRWNVEALTHRQDWNTTSAIEATSEVIESHFCP
jgi:hypothetical protein